MLTEVKYLLKSDEQRRTRRAQFFVTTREHAREEFYKWVQEQGVELSDVLVMSIRDASNDTITLDVKDTKIDTKGEV